MRGCGTPSLIAPPIIQLISWASGTTQVWAQGEGACTSDSHEPGNGTMQARKAGKKMRPGVLSTSRACGDRRSPPVLLTVAAPTPFICGPSKGALLCPLNKISSSSGKHLLFNTPSEHHHTHLAARASKLSHLSPCTLQAAPLKYSGQAAKMGLIDWIISIVPLAEHT